MVKSLDFIEFVELQLGRKLYPHEVEYYQRIKNLAPDETFLYTPRGYRVIKNLPSMSFEFKLANNTPSLIGEQGEYATKSTNRKSPACLSASLREDG